MSIVDFIKNIYDRGNPTVDDESMHISDFFQDYPYYIKIPNTIFEKSDIWYDPAYVLKSWCTSNCKDGWKSDYLIVDDHGILNIFGGEAYLYFAFMNRSDLTWFMLGNEF